ncbi:hypothetical protein ACFY36_04290 [Actinoplanes sp. NPDC000266]
MRHLGVAFATKYLYFCNAPGSAPALILDSLVQRWLRQHTDCHLRLDWHAGDYTRYLHMVSTWAADNDGTASVLEAIEDAAAAFAALTDVSPVDVDDFERGIRQLKRILFTRSA